MHDGLASCLFFPNVSVPQARFGISWGVMGAASLCMSKAREYVLER